MTEEEITQKEKEGWRFKNETSHGSDFLNIYSPRIGKWFYASDKHSQTIPLEILLKREEAEYIIYLYNQNEFSIKKQLAPYFLKIAQGTNLKELTAVIKIPTK